MASKNQNKPPTPVSPSNSKCLVDEVSVDNRRKIGFSKMVGPANGSRTRQAFSIVNGGQDLAPANGTASNAGSDCGSVEFTREEVEGLLIEKMKTKNKFNLKDKCDQMMEYIKRLRLCIKWFQEFEGSYLLEQEKLRNLLEMAEKKCSDMEMLMKAKEEELNSIIMELRKNYSSLQEKFMKEESDRLAAVDSLAKEKEAKVAAERMQASLSEELRSAQRENSSANQKISSLNDMYKRLQEYNTSLQQYNSKLQSELATTNETLKRVEKEKAAVVENLSTLRGHYNSLQDQLTSSRTRNAIGLVAPAIAAGLGDIHWAPSSL